MALINYFRTDGWVKSVQGYAVPGAQIYVCSQPANVNALPPSPLVNIFSDVNGLVPITQPILTDGFGHYDFYAQAGVYTIVVGLNGIISQVYPDQSTGGASGTNGAGGGTALQLQVNGTLNVNQLLLNLRGQNSVTVSDAGNGTINITGPTFQTGGVTNTLQSVLNVKPGTGIGLASDALGGLTITNTLPGTIGVPAGQNILQGLLGNTGSIAAFGFADATLNSSGGTHSFVHAIPVQSLLCAPSQWKASIKTNGAATITCQIVSTAINSSTVVSTANVTFNGGQTSPVFGSSAIQTSDVIAFPLDFNHDYYFVLNSSSGLIDALTLAGSGAMTVGCYVQISNFIGTSSITFSGGTAETGKSLLYAFQAA